MRKWRLQNFKMNRSKQHLMLLLVFCAFSVVQLSSIEHQKQHFNGTDESTCVLCITTPDHVLPSSDVSLLLQVDNNSHFSLGLLDSITTSAPVYYSSRAPPKVC